MTMLDDQVDDLLRSFRADEAVLDDDVRDRMWEEVARATGVAVVPLGSGRREVRGRRVLAAAAALLVAALVGGVVARATVDDRRDRTTGTARADATATGAPTLDQLADQAAGLTGPVLGDPGATYAHVVASTVRQPPDDVEATDTAGRTETWVGIDGTGRERGAQADGSNAQDIVLGDPDSLALGSVRASTALALPADGGAVIAAVIDDIGAERTSPESAARPLVDLLAQPGIPAAARAGALRALDELGFTTAPGIEAGTVTLQGAAEGDAVVTAVYEPATGRVQSRQVIEADGSTVATWWSEADLRRTTD